MQRRVLQALVLNLVAAYAPFLWVFLIDYPWGEYRWLWVKIYPVLPGLVPAELPRVLLGLPRWGSEGLLFAAAGVVTLVMLFVATAAGASGRTPERQRLFRLVAAGVLLAGCTASSIVSYGLFRM